MTTLHTLFADTGRRLRCLYADESGATAIEYAIIAAGISIVIVAAVSSIGTSVNTTFTTVSNGLN